MNSKLVEQLQTYFDGEATPEERLRMEALIAESAECQALLKQWKQQRRALLLLKKTETSDGAFVSRVMNRLEQLKAPETESAELPDFLRWLFPAMGYALSAILVFITLSVKQPSVNADTILLSELPQETHSVLMAKKTDASQMFNTEEMR